MHLNQETQTLGKSNLLFTNFNWFIIWIIAILFDIQRQHGTYWKWKIDFFCLRDILNIKQHYLVIIVSINIFSFQNIIVMANGK